MRYLVSWTPLAEEELSTAWLESSDRESVTRAANTLDLKIHSDPLRCGESRASSVVRVAIEGPLRIDFEVIEDDKKVRVLAVSLV
jgi:mRNA-degrading endonuclease RelE of RelBE toxin-antitoxin system